MKYDAEVSQAISRVAGEQGVTLDHALVQAMIQSETGHAGAGVAVNSQGTFYGPMNVKDSTARSLGASDPRTLATPSIGIYYGTRALANMVRRFPGDSAAAISAYKVGPAAAVRDSSGRFPNQDQVDLVYSIWTQYKRLFTGGAVAAGAGTLLVVVVGSYLALRAARSRSRAA